MAPPQGQMRPSRYLIALGAIFVILFGVVLGFGKGSFSQRLEPKLGLDLVGGTQLTLIATSLNGSPPSQQNLELARQIIQDRVDGLGVAEAEVVTEGTDRIIISAPGNNSDTIKQVGTPAQLRFRTLINEVADTGGVVPTATPSASPSASGTASPKPTSPAPSTPAATTPPPTTPAATTPPPTSPAATPAPTNQAEKLAAVQRKLGPAYGVAQQLVASVDPSTAAASQLQQIGADKATLAALKPFSTLKPDDVAVLDPAMQFLVPTISCDQLDRRPAGSIVDKTKRATACEKGHTKEYLDISKVEGTDIASAAANLTTTAGSEWVVDLTFNSAGAAKWTALTRDANEAKGCVVQYTKKAGGQSCRVAVVLDNTVVSSPGIEQVLSTQSQISGSFSQDSARLLATQLEYGALPLTFDPGDLQSVSATLGTDYLKAGLLAAGIGMLLVIAYAFFYYRLLGSVITLSLLLSALLTFGMLVLLGRQIGFTLTLAGIAGFIVSLGVAADSFVIYFERLKDEIREGRSPRSAIPRAWHRARRTIITANVVTVLAAVVLYVVGVSSVRGFAFALGMATVLDLVIVFLFRHPMMTLLARSPAFLSPRVSGLGRVLQHAREDAPPASNPRRPKEA